MSKNSPDKQSAFRPLLRQLLLFPLMQTGPILPGKHRNLKLDRFRELRQEFEIELPELTNQDPVLQPTPQKQNLTEWIIEHLKRKREEP
jgi:hypothetical protein